MVHMRPEAWIITVGNEILIGRIVNTNAAWLGRRLTLLGFRVARVVTVPDVVDEIASELRAAASRARVIVTTGGLGPTYDDVTLEGVARAFWRRLTLNEDALRMVESFYANMGEPLTPERRKMAFLPEGARPLRNPVGAAPGALLELPDGVIVASLPGVPREMEAMFESHVEPVLRRIAPRSSIVECGFTVKGVPESSLAPYIRRASRVSERVYVKSHPRGFEDRDPVVEVRVLVSAPEASEARRLAKQALGIVREGVIGLGGSIIEEDNC